MASNTKVRYRLLPIAETNGRFSNFAPYVASISNDGLVAFPAAVRQGGSGVYAGDGATVTAVTDPVHGPFSEVCSHPDLNERGDVCFYATCTTGERGVFLVRGDTVQPLASSFGPLGPTINDAGSVAFRSLGTSGAEGIFTGHPGRTRMVAEIGAVFRAFHGLPVIRRDGSVCFRADVSSGVHGIYVGDGERTATVVESGAVFKDLGSFPITNDVGAVAFCATLQAGGSGVFVASDGTIEAFVDSSSGFESFRGVLINNSGPVVFFATPTGGSLGMFTGPHPDRDCVLAVGSPLFGSTIEEFALNPVSINDAGQLAIRVRLSDQRQFILRADRVN